MSIPILGNYSREYYPFPSRDINPKLKTDKYCGDWARAIYGLFCQNKTAWNSNTQNEFNVLRAYSRGEQDVTQYQKWLLDSGGTTDTTTGAVTAFDDLPISKVAKREGWYNIMWQNISPAPQILAAIHGMFDKADYDLFVDTIDADSRKLAEEQKYVKLMEAQNAEWQNTIKTAMGIPIDEDIVYPKSKEELDMFEAQGGFKLNVARAMQKILRHTFNISEWDTETFEKCLDDLVCIEYAGIEDYFDTEDNKFKSRYLDPDRAVIQFSNKFDYSDSEYAGYYDNWTISNLRNKVPDVPETEWFSLANRFTGQYGNANVNLTSESKYSKLDPSSNTYYYDGFKVPVFHAWWIDTDTTKKLYYKSFRGRESIYELGWDSEVKPLSKKQTEAGANQEIKHIFKRQPYECYWVMDTDYVFDFGPIKMASREKLSKPQLPVHFTQMLQPSLMKRIRPIIDQITQTFLRHQNSLAMMVENGVAINTTMLGNVTMGAGKLKPAEVLRLGKETGFWLYSYAPGTGLYSGGAALPISQIKGGMGERVRETIETFDLLFGLLEKLTGINPVSLGASPDPNAPVGTTQAALQATTNVLKPYMDACYELKKSVGTCMMRRIQVGIKNNEQIRKAYVGVISPSDMESLKMMEHEGVQYGFSLRAKPDMAMKAEFTEWCNISLQNIREQRPGADLPDIMYFKTALNRGEDIYDLIEQMRYVIMKNKQEADKQVKENMQVQGQVNAQAEQAKQQGLQAQIQAEAQAKIAEEMVRGKVKMNQTKLEGNLALLEQTRQAMLAEQGIITTPTGGR